MVVLNFGGTLFVGVFLFLNKKVQSFQMTNDLDVKSTLLISNNVRKIITNSTISPQSIIVFVDLVFNLMM